MRNTQKNTDINNIEVLKPPEESCHGGLRTHKCEVAQSESQCRFHKPLLIWVLHSFAVWKFQTSDVKRSGSISPPPPSAGCLSSSSAWTAVTILSVWAVCTSPHLTVCSLTWFSAPQITHKRKRPLMMFSSQEGLRTHSHPCKCCRESNVHQWQLLAAKHRSEMLWVLKKGWCAFVCVRGECVMRLRRPLEKSLEACLSNEMNVQSTVSAPLCQ